MDLISGQGVALATHRRRDLAAVTGLLKAVLAAGAADRAFIDVHCEGFQVLREEVLASS